MSVRLHIPEPCHESWENMQPNKDGRHCMACQKTVVDFSNMTDKEILDYISQASGNVCGRVDKLQLNRGLRENNVRKRFSFAYVWNLLILFFVFGGKAKAQGALRYKLKTEEKCTPKLMGDTTLVQTQAIDTVKKDSAIEAFKISMPSIDMETVTITVDPDITLVTLGLIAPQETPSMLDKWTREIQDWFPTKKVNIYPNPVYGGNDVHAELILDDKGEYRVDLIDANGRILWMRKIENNEGKFVLSIPTQRQWSKGVYWLRVTGTRSRKVYHGKIIIQW